PYLLAAPVEVTSDRVGREQHKRAHARMRVEWASRMRISSGRRTERKQRGPVTSVRPDRQSRPDNESDAVTQRGYSCDAGDMAHHTEGVAVDVELTALKPRPVRDAGAHEPALEAGVAPPTLGVEDRIVAAVARIELA